MIKSIIAAAIITNISIPLWYLYQIQLWRDQGRHLNAAGVLAYWFLVLVLALPFSYFITIIFALLFKKQRRKTALGRSMTVAVFYTLAFLGLYLLHDIMMRNGWLVSWHLSFFMLPPSLIGTLSLIFLWKDVEDTTV